MGRFLCHQRQRKARGDGGGETEEKRERLCLLHLRLLAPIRLAENIRPRLGTPQLCCIPSHVPLITNIRRHCQHIDLPIPRSVWAIDGSSRPETPNSSQKMPIISFLSFPHGRGFLLNSQCVSGMFNLVTWLITPRPH